MADLLITDARDAEHIEGEALQRELAIVVADGATRGRDINADVRYRLSSLCIQNDSGQGVSQFLCISQA